MSSTPLLPVRWWFCERRVELTMLGSGQLKPESMITGKIQMDEVEEKGFKALIHDKDNHVKILVEIKP